LIDNAEYYRDEGSSTGGEEEEEEVRGEGAGVRL